MSRKDASDGTGGEESPARRGGKAPKRQRRSRRRRIIGWVAVLTTILVTGSSLAAYAAYLNEIGRASCRERV